MFPHSDDHPFSLSEYVYNWIDNGGHYRSQYTAIQGERGPKQNLIQHYWNMSDVQRVSAPFSQEFARWVYELDPEATKRLVADKFRSWALKNDFHIDDGDLHFTEEFFEEQTHNGSTIENVSVTVRWWGRPIVMLRGGREDATFEVDPQIIKTGCIVREEIAPMDEYLSSFTMQNATDLMLTKEKLAMEKLRTSRRVFLLIGWDPSERAWVFGAESR